MSNIDSELHKAAGLYNDGDYEACITLFEEMANRHKSEAETIAYLDMFSAIKYRSYYELNQHEKLYQELGVLLDKYQDDHRQSASIVAGLGQFNLDSVLLEVPATHRYIAGQHYRVAFAQQRFGQLPVALETFQSFSPLPFEFNMALKLSGVGDVLFTPQHIKHFTSKALPNNNAYFEFEAQSDKLKIAGSIPLPGNDAICESGTITLTTDNGKQQIEINRAHVEEVPPFGPYALKVTMPEGKLDIYNSRLAGSKPDEGKDSAGA